MPQEQNTEAHLQNCNIEQLAQQQNARSCAQEDRNYPTLFGEANVFNVEAKDGTPLRMLSIGDGFQSATFVGKRRFEPPFAYCRALDQLLFDACPSARRILLLGGGAFSYPKYALTTHPGATMDVVEIDPAVVEIARKHFYLDELERLCAAESTHPRLQAPQPTDCPSGTGSASASKNAQAALRNQAAREKSEIPQHQENACSTAHVEAKNAEDPRNANSRLRIFTCDGMDFLRKATGQGGAPVPAQGRVCATAQDGAPTPAQDGAPAPAGKYDAIINDCFAGIVQDAPLLSDEGLALAKHVLAPQGVYLLNGLAQNANDNTDWETLDAIESTLRRHFHLVLRKPVCDQEFFGNINHLFLAR